MKAAADRGSKEPSDFYLSTIAPVDRRGDKCLRPVDVVMLTVLFLELAVLMRLFLAN